MSEAGDSAGAAATTGTVRLARDGAVARITFDRPAARNAMTLEMYGQLDEHLEAVSADADVRVVVLRGAGGAFVAGTDIGHFSGFRTAEDGIVYERHIDAVVDRLESLPVPTVAAVEGPAMGGGMLLAAACDLRVCTPDARFGVPIARTVGNCLSMANYARLVAHLGPSRTKALVFLADHLGADEAQAAGFVRVVAPTDRLEAQVDEVALRVASHAPVTLQVTKEAVRRLVARGVPKGDDLVRRAYGSDDFQRGVWAFLARELPEWTGK